jgi:hypothetical protein
MHFRDTLGWKQLCVQDSDGDGESNGQELGDPCCLWPATPARSQQLSNPADPSSFSNSSACPYTIQLEGGTEAADKEALDIIRSIAPLPPPPSRIEQASSGLLLLLGLIACRSAKRLSEIDASTLAGLAWAAYFWTDVTGACMHIVLDDPSSRSIPLLGYSAVMFQRHHEHPLGLLEEGWLSYICRHHIAIAAFTFVTSCLLRPRSKSLLAFNAFTNGWWLLMVASHRWAHHTDRHSLPPLVSSLQECNLLITYDQHQQHHTTFTSSFAFLSGWSDVIISPLLFVIPCTSTASWCALLLLSGVVLPVLLTDILEGHLTGTGQSLASRRSRSHVRKRL